MPAVTFDRVFFLNKKVYTCVSEHLPEKERKGGFLLHPNFILNTFNIYIPYWGISIFVIAILILVIYKGHLINNAQYFFSYTYILF
jgi:hypothetical protein